MRGTGLMSGVIGLASGIAMVLAAFVGAAFVTRPLMGTLTPHLHLTDDQGWRIQSRAFPAITDQATWRAETRIGMMPLDGRPQPGDGTPHGGYYPLADLAEITAHAAARGITVVPEVDLPAHASALLAAVPELRVPGTPVPEVATRFGPHGRIVSPLPAARKTLATLLAEVAQAVDSPCLHVGGDEASLADWSASAEVGAYLAARGLGSVAALRPDLTTFVVGQVEALGWAMRSQKGKMIPPDDDGTMRDILDTVLATMPLRALTAMGPGISPTMLDRVVAGLNGQWLRAIRGT